MSDDTTPLDQSLRDALENYAPQPSAALWDGLAQRLAALPPDSGPPPPPRPRRRWPVPLPLWVFLAALLGAVGGWWLPRPADSSGPLRPLAASATAPETASASSPATALGSAANGFGPRTEAPVAARANGRFGAPQPGVAPGFLRPLKYAAGASNGGVAAAAKTPDAAVGPAGQPLAAAPNSGLLPTTRTAETGFGLTIGQPDTARAPAGSAAPAAEAAAASSPATPPTLRVLVALEHRCLDQLPALPAAPAAPDTAARRALALTLRAERHELLRLQRRNDSLLLALGEIVPAAAPAIAQTPADTPERETSNKKPETKKWSLLLAAAPEQNYLGTASALRDEATNLRRNQETGRSGLAAALMAEYQFKPRLSLGAGLGYTRVGAELRQALRITDYTVRYDTTLTTTLTGYIRVSNTYSIRVVQLPQLSPVFNASGQVVRYDTVYVPRNDTLRSTIISRDTIRSTRRVVTPLLTSVERTSYQTLRPDYHFLTLPVLVRYRLGRPDTRARWWADASAGAQLQFFLGGSQLVSTDGGATFRTEHVGVADGPFRPFNLALSGSIALNYALTNRLSVSFAPTLRWQTLSVFRPETGLRQQATSTGVQVGVRFKL